MNEYEHIVKQADLTDQIEQIEKITNEWQNKIKQITDERTIKQYTYIKTEQADDGTREDKSDRRGRTKGRLDENKENKLKEKMYSPSSQMVTKQVF